MGRLCDRAPPGRGESVFAKRLIKRLINHADRDGRGGATRTRGQINEINWLTVWETLSTAPPAAFRFDVADESVRRGERILIFSPRHPWKICFLWTWAPTAYAAPSNVGGINVVRRRYAFRSMVFNDNWRALVTDFTAISLAEYSLRRVKLTHEIFNKCSLRDRVQYISSTTMRNRYIKAVINFRGALHYNFILIVDSIICRTYYVTEIISREGIASYRSAT